MTLPLVMYVARLVTDDWLGERSGFSVDDGDTAEWWDQKCSRPFNIHSR